VTHAVLMQKRVEMAFLIVLAFADVRWNVQVPVGLRGVTGKMLPAEVILESKTALSVLVIDLEEYPKRLG